MLEKITLWYRYNEKQKDWAYNHLERGIVERIDDIAPVPKSKAQKASWTPKSLWMIRYGEMINGVVHEAPLSHEWMVTEQER